MEAPERVFDQVNLLSDPLYKYCTITKPLPGGASSEVALLDHPWLQRQRRIHQLQSAWWVFHTAEHSRFQHAVGAMHLTGQFTDHLYASLQQSCPEVPSRSLVVEVMRIAGLLHDVGHGPFGHFFDTEVLSAWGIDHEDLTRALARGPLADLIGSLDRSPLGPFERGEAVLPDWVAWVMEPRDMADVEPPRWLRALKPLLCGPASTDNMDYVPRDAYMCGVAVGPVDLARLRHYMFIKDGNLVLHQHGAPALEVFLAARLYMYNHVYFHRTVRRIDLHIRPVFAATCERLLPGNPMENWEAYRQLTDWSLMAEVERLQSSPRDEEERRLGRRWEAVTTRQLPFKLAYEGYRELSRPEPPPELRDAHQIEERIREALPPGSRGVGLEVDLAGTAPRPDNPAAEPLTLRLFDPISGRVEEEAGPQLLARLLPARTLWLRVYTDASSERAAIRAAAAEVLPPILD